MVIEKHVGERNLGAFIYGVPQLPRSVPFLANVLLPLYNLLSRYLHVCGVSHLLETWRALESGPGYLCSSCRVGGWGPLSLRHCPSFLAEVAGGYPSF